MRTAVYATVGLLILSLCAPAAIGSVTATDHTVQVESATDNVDSDGNTGAAETNDGDDVYGSIDAAVDNATVDGRVEVAPGTYDGNASIETPGLTVVATGDVVLDGGSEYANTGLYVTRGASDVVIDGFTLRRYNHGVEVFGSNVTIQHLNIQETYEEGIYVEAATPTIRGTTLERAGQDNTNEGWDEESSIVVRDATSVHLESVTALESDLHGATISGTETVSIEDSRFADNTDHGISIKNAKSVNVQNTTFFNNLRHGLLVTGSETFGRQVTVTESTVRLNSDYGIRVEGTAGDDTATISNTSFTDNGVSESGEGYDSQSALRISDVETVTASNLSVEASEENGVLIENADSATVRNLTALGSGDDGLELWNIRSVTVADVTANNNEARGLSIGGSEDTSRTISLVNVSARLNNYEGIYLEGTSGTDDATLETIETRQNGQEQYDEYVGLRIKDVETVDAETVTATSNTDSGVWISGGSEPSVTFDRLSTERNGYNGITVDAAKTITIRNSSITGSDSDGIDITGTDLLTRKVTLTNVTVAQTGEHGIWATGTSGDDTLTATNVTVDTAGEVTGFEDPEEGVYLTQFEAVTMTQVVAEENFNDGLYLDDTGTTTIENSSLTNNEDNGLVVDSSADASATVIHNSTISGNADLGISNLASGVVNATMNDWGARNGPSSDTSEPLEDPVTGALADGDGDAVSEGETSGVANVRFDPYLGDGGADSGSQTVFSAIAGSDNVVSTSELQESITYWAVGQAVPGTDGKTISTADIQQFVQYWALGTPVE